MVAHMTPRARLVLLAVAALVTVPSLLVIDGILSHGTPSASVSVEVTDGPDAVIVRPARPHPVPAVARGLPLAAAIVLGGASVIRCGRRRPVRGLRFRLDDVGDGWRALLLGAPPTLL